MRAIEDAKSEITRLLLNKRIWILDKYTGIEYVSGPWIVTSVRQFLPAGPTKSGERKVSLVDFFSDGGRRVASVASIWTKDPKKASRPW